VQLNVTRLAVIALTATLAGCASLLPSAQVVTEGPWQTYDEAIQTFAKIIPNKTTLDDLKKIKLDPISNPNITILNYSDVISRFIPSPSVNESDLAPGVKTCIMARAACQGYEVVQKFSSRKRYGSFWADFLNFRRRVDITGWSFTGVILVKDGVVIYTLTGGQPVIHQTEDNENPLGPFQGSGESAARTAVPFP
jgi:hypothetical protein